MIQPTIRARHLFQSTRSKQNTKTTVVRMTVVAFARPPTHRSARDTDLLFLCDGERVSVHGADDDERDHEQQQFPVQDFVEAAPPQEQQPGESRAARRRHLRLVADGHCGLDGGCSGGGDSALWARAAR